MTPRPPAPDPTAGLPPEVRARMRETFLDEAAALTAALEAALLALEHAPADEALLHEAFRAAHTIKGSAAGVGYAAVAGFVHGLESALDALRSRRYPVEAAGLTALLQAVDALRALLDAAAHDGAPPPATDAARARLEAAFAAASTPAPAAAAHPAAVDAPGAAVLEAEAVDSGLAGALRTLEAEAVAAVLAEVGAGAALYRVVFRASHDSFERGLDPVALVAALADEGRVLRTRALLDTLPPLGALEPMSCHLGFDVLLLSRTDAEELRLIFEFCPAGSTLEVAALHAPQLPRLAALLAASAAEPAAAALWGGVARAEAPPQGAASAPAAGDAARSIRVRQSRLDELLNAVGELVTARNGLLHLQRQVEAGLSGPELERRLKAGIGAVDRMVAQLQADAMGLRMVPVRLAFERLPRVVRDVATRQEKQVALELVGQSTELDKLVADALAEPLVHLVRNAVDHGIEPPAARIAAGKPAEGRLRVEARREGGSVLIEVRDDGAGIDPERLRRSAAERGVMDAAAAARLTDAEALDLVFAAGFSTAAVVTDISGRGVGMDVVRSSIVKLGGTVSIASQAGEGTTLRLALPLSLSVVRALMVRAGGQHYALPLEVVRETAALPRRAAQTIHRQPVVHLGGVLMAVLPLAALMRLPATAAAPVAGPAAEAADDTQPVVVVEAGGERLALAVDALDPPQEIMVKPVESYLTAGGAVAGAAVLGDGRVALVLEPAGLARLAAADAEPQVSAR